MARHAGVEVLHESFPSFWPSGRGDLVVWSEIVYYLTAAQVEQALIGLERWLEPGGDLVAVHYTGATDYPLAGSEIGSILDDVDFLERECRHVDDGFELGVWRRRSGTDA